MGECCGGEGITPYGCLYGDDKMYIIHNEQRVKPEDRIRRMRKYKTE